MVVEADAAVERVAGEGEALLAATAELAGRPRIRAGERRPVAAAGGLGRTSALEPPPRDVPPEPKAEVRGVLTAAAVDLREAAVGVEGGVGFRSSLAEDCERGSRDDG